MSPLLTPTQAAVVSVAATLLVAAAVILVVTAFTLVSRRRRDAQAEAWALRAHTDAQLDLLTAQTLAAMRDLARRSGGGQA